MGGRGASSGNGSSIAKGDYTYTKNGANLAIKVEDVKGNKIIARVAGTGINGAAYYGNLVEATPNSEMIKGMTKKQKYTFDTQNNIVSALKQQTNVDISKAIDNDRFSTKSRKYFDIDRRKLNPNEFNAVVKYLKQDKGLRIEANGANHYSIYFKK